MHLAGIRLIEQPPAGRHLAHGPRDYRRDDKARYQAPGNQGQHEERLSEPRGVTLPQAGGMLREGGHLSNCEIRILRPVYEVELKFPLPDPTSVRARLAGLQARAGRPIEQTDAYFAHPVRDFSSTDEALRLRSSQGSNWLTYKGPVISVQTKTRRELEIRLEDGPQAAERLSEMLGLLGFAPVRTVRKVRVPYHLERAGRAIEVAQDTVEELGEYLEIEVLADEGQIAAAQDVILALAAQWGLPSPEPRSYLELLLERDRKEF